MVAEAPAANGDEKFIHFTIFTLMMFISLSVKVLAFTVLTEQVVDIDSNNNLLCPWTKS